MKVGQLFLRIKPNSYSDTREDRITIHYKKGKYSACCNSWRHLPQDQAGILLNKDGSGSRTFVKIGFVLWLTREGRMGGNPSSMEYCTIEVEKVIIDKEHMDGIIKQATAEAV